MGNLHYTIDPDKLLRYFVIVAFVLLGIMVFSEFGSKRKDLTGRSKLLLTLFMALIIYNSTILLPANATYVISLVMGLGSQKLIHKWINKQIWDKYDVLDKTQGTNDKDNIENKEDEE